MKTVNEKKAILYSKMAHFNWLVEKTSKFIKWALDRVNNPYVACSFGKDSSVMLHLIIKYNPQIPVIWITFPETKYLNNYYEIVEIWKRKYKINLKEIFIDIPAHIPFDDTIAFPKKPFDSYFVGITKEESFARRLTLKTHGKFFRKKDGMIRICPMADWKINDIEAYCYSQNLPILNSYKTEGFESRTVTGFTEDIYAFRINQLNELKNRDIKSFNNMILKWPELKKYV